MLQVFIGVSDHVEAKRLTEWKMQAPIEPSKCVYAMILMWLLSD